MSTEQVRVEGSTLFTEQPIDYRCKQCGTMSSASFDMCVKREKLCVDCIVKNAREKAGSVGGGVIGAAKLVKTKQSRISVAKREWMCCNCGTKMEMHIKPWSCKSCNKRAFRELKQNKKETINV
jgi:rubredoxin